MAKKKKKLKKPLKKKLLRKKPIKKKPVRKKIKAKKPTRKKPILPKIKPPGKVIGKITHYFPQVMAGVIKLKDTLALGDIIKIKGHTTDFTQTVTSIQIDRAPISVGKKGQEIGLHVNSRVRRRDVVYKI